MAAAARSAPAIPSAGGFTFENPHASKAMALKKQPKQKLAEVQEHAERLLNLAEQHRNMLIACFALIVFQIVISLVFFGILYFTGFTIQVELENYGLPFHIMVILMIVAGLGVVGMAAISFTFLLALFRTTRISTGKTSVAALFVVGAILLGIWIPILNLLILWIADHKARMILKSNGFEIGFFGVPKDKVQV